MKVRVRVRSAAVPLEIDTEFIKLEAAMKLALAFSGGMAKTVIQEGAVTVNGETMTMRGKKLRPGDRFAFEGQEFFIQAHADHES